jgi:hypothetical protein
MALVRFLTAGGHSIKAVGRNDYALSDGEFAAKIDGANAVVNLAGAPVGVRWSENYKKVIYSSRVETTRKIAAAFKLCRVRPQLLINASAVGIYASGGAHDEYRYEYGKDFLASLCAAWEAAALKVKEEGARCVIFRFGIVLDKRGGALNKMLLPFSLGLGGTLAGGAQYMSWISLEDLLSAFNFVINDEKPDGVFNLTSPMPVTNAEFTAALASALKRPAFFGIPEFVLKLIFSDGAKILCEGSKVYPKRLLDAGFKFRHENIKTAIAQILGK